MRRVRVAWSRTDYFTAVLELEEHHGADPAAAFDGDSEELLDMEELNAVDLNGHMTYGSTDRSVDDVELVDAEDNEPAAPYGAGR